MVYVEQKAFNYIKRIFDCNTLLAYIYLNKRFDINIDARYFQLGSVISQESKSVAF